MGRLQLVGEGRGRLGLDQNQYVFSYEALLKDEDDWVLAVSVPLHGEEVMVLSDLRTDSPDLSTTQSFEARLQREIDHRFRGRNVNGKQYVNTLRTMVRFLLAPQLGLDRKCEKTAKAEYSCQLNKVEFQIIVEKSKIRIKKIVSQTHHLELVGENLTEPFFGRTNFLLLSDKSVSRPAPVMSLELFWK